MRPLISIIAAVSDNGAIGKNGDLLWHLPADMKHFKSMTVGHAVVMGRKTFDSLPKGPLPDRKNVVLTSVPEAYFEDAFPATSLTDAISLCSSQKEIYIIGGGMVYKQALSMADRLYLTFVHHNFPDADTFFPEIDFSEWEEMSREDHEADEKNPYPYTFVNYRRKKR